MKYFLIALAFLPMAAMAQSNYTTDARSLMMSGQFDSALVLLNKAAIETPSSIEPVKDQTYVYYLQRNFAQARITGEKMIGFSTAGPDAYQLLGFVYKEIAAFKDAERLYKKGLDLFPENAVLLYEAGDLAAQQKNYKEATGLWVKSIESDPNYSNNYYALAKYYFDQQQWLRSALMAEIFVNIESLSKRTKEMKNVVADSYKQFFREKKITGSEFYAAVASNLVTTSGDASINPQSLTSIRTTFISDWFKQGPPAKFPFRLFDHHQQLIREQMFDAYNQWLFDIDNSYDAWKAANPGQAQKFEAFKSGRVYKTPKGQYYK